MPNTSDKQSEYSAKVIEIDGDKTNEVDGLIVRKFTQEWPGYGSVFYQEVVPRSQPKLDVVLLHGQRFSSANWVDIKTLHTLASSGYRVLAFDLPSYGKSTFKIAKQSRDELARILAMFLKLAKVEKPVVVSPSMSGKYSLPFVVKEETSGYIPIAIISTTEYSTDDFKQFKTPTLIVQGSDDKGLGDQATKNLQSLIPDAKTEIIKDAGHACYLDKPEQFHQIILKFLDNL